METRTTKARGQQGPSLPTWLCLGGTGRTRRVPRPAATGRPASTRQSLARRSWPLMGRPRVRPPPAPETAITVGTAAAQPWQPTPHNPNQEPIWGAQLPRGHLVQLTLSVNAARPPWSRGLPLPTMHWLQKASDGQTGPGTDHTALSGQVWELMKRPVPPARLRVRAEGSLENTGTRTERKTLATG